MSTTTDQQKSSAVTNGQSSNFHRPPLSFELRRFHTGSGPADDQEAFWRFRIGAGVFAGKPLFDIDADPVRLREMARWLEQAANTVATDGGRNVLTKEGGE